MNQEEKITPDSFLSYIWLPAFLFVTMLAIPTVPAVAATIMVPVPDMNGNALGTITVNTDGMIPAGNIPPIGVDRTGTIVAGFKHNKPNNAAAAQAAWGGHFSWVNKVVSEVGTAMIFDKNGNPAMVPYVDPLSGGNFSQKPPPGMMHPPNDDDVPFFWNEKDGGVERTLSDVDMDGIPEFIDGPADMANSMIEFETYLVSVPGNVGQMANMTFHVLAGFTWKFNEGPIGGGGNDESITNLAAININAGNIGNIRTMLNTSLGNSGFNNWQTTSHIPEPATLTLLALGGLMLVRRGQRAA